jgi:hypothetical protein
MLDSLKYVMDVTYMPEANPAPNKAKMKNITTGRLA